MEAPAQTQVPVQAELKISFLATGQISVSGPIQNEMLALWMLDKARDAIKKLNDQVANQQITPATIVPPFGNNGRG